VIECEQVDAKSILITLEAARGLRVGIGLEGGLPDPDTYLLAWHFKPESRARLSSRFSSHVNPHHRQKATLVARGAADLLAQLSVGLELARSGEAFLADLPHVA
jgi:hypothetical protein